MNVYLFIPCLVNEFLPQLGLAAVDLLERAGCRVIIPKKQRCCGQVGYNSGQWGEAAKVATTLIRELQDVTNPIIVPSASCTSMLRDRLGDLELADMDIQAWNHFRDNIFELSEFIRVYNLEEVIQPFPTLNRCAVFHASCHLLHNTNSLSVVHNLLKQVPQLRLHDEPALGACCGFGGIFSTKLPELSVKMGTRLLHRIKSAGCDTLIVGDVGCTLHLHSIAIGTGCEIQVLHYAQALTSRDTHRAVP